MRHFLTLLATTLWAQNVQALQLDLPIDCNVGQTCHIQSFIDHDPGPQARDYQCGSLTYDGHKGTDFYLTSYQQMRDGVKVLAAADGVVGGVRDGVADQRYESNNHADVENRECGNGVRIQHGDGWVTLYCHMQQGSVAVQQGQSVKAGEVLGKVGLSGQTQYPHLHLGVMKDKTYIDPFSSTDKDTGCAMNKQPLWSAATLARLPYVASDVFQAGFAPKAPKREEVQQGAMNTASIPADAPVLAFWFEAYGIRQGDLVTTRLSGADGKVLAEHSEPYEKNMAQIFRFVGKKRPQGGWPKGSYTGSVIIERDRQAHPYEAVRYEQTITIQ